ncbi:hypothetical protein [Nocardia sp. CY41]|uniref:hypothetical protein n=1 Tax=Nocardia sp. CY41 TaxID=2608686 RepID=UPI0013590AAD|nr:hypothetical protein [Nocardia sp. CY41]
MKSRKRRTASGGVAAAGQTSPTERAAPASAGGPVTGPDSGPADSGSSCVVGGAAGIPYARAGWLGLVCGIGLLLVIAALLLWVSHRAHHGAATVRTGSALETAAIEV